MAVTNLDALTLSGNLIVVGDFYLTGTVDITGDWIVSGTITTEEGYICGTSGSPTAVTYNGTKVMSVYTTSASTDGSTSLEPQIFNNVLTGAGQVGGRFRVNMATEVTLGSWANAFKASADLGTTGGVTGLLSAICAELTMATTSISGTYAALELEMTYGATSGSLPKPCFIYANTNGTAKGTFDTYGDFMILGTGFTAASGKVLGTDTSTIRIGTGALGGTKRYIPLSTATASFTFTKPLSIGTSGVGETVTFYGDNALSNFVWAEAGDTNGSLTLGATTDSVDFRVFGATATTYLHWDGSADDLLLVGTATQLGVAGTTVSTTAATGSIHTAGGLGVAGAIFTTGTLNVGTSGVGETVTFYGDNANSNFVWAEAGDTNGSLTLGASTDSVDFRVYGTTATTYLHWDGSVDDLLLVGTATQLAVAGTTASTTNVTGSLRTAGGLGVAADAFIGGDLGLNTNASDIIVIANTAAALEVYDSTTKLLAFDTRNTVTAVTNAAFIGAPATITAAGGVTKNTVSITPGTTTLTGSTGVTAMDGVALTIAQPTITDEDAVTVALASTVYIADAPTGAGSGPATLTAAYALNVAAGGVHFGGPLNMSYADGQAISVGTSAGTRLSMASSGSLWVVWSKNMATSGGSAGLHFDHAVGYQGSTTLQATGIRGYLRILTGTTSTGGSPIMEGAAGYFTNEGTCNGDSLQIAGVRGCIVDGGVYTEVSHLSSFWADTQLDQAVSLGDYSMYRATNNGDTEVGAYINLWGTGEYFLIADGAGGGSQWESGAGTDAGGEAGHLLCKVGGQIRKIKLYSLA